LDLSCSAAVSTLFERRNPHAIADVACSIGYAKGEYRSPAPAFLDRIVKLPIKTAADAAFTSGGEVSKRGTTAQARLTFAGVDRPFAPG
jgi:hypothetical protein